MGRITKEEEKRRKKAKIDYKSQIKIRKLISFSCHREYDKDILEQLESQENPSAYIKNLIREDMKKSQNQQTTIKFKTQND